MHSLGSGIPTPSLRTPIAFVNDGFVRPLVSEVMGKMPATKQAWISEFSSQEKREEIRHLFEEKTGFVFLSFDQTGTFSKVFDLKVYALQLATSKATPVGIYADVVRTLTRPPFDSEQIREGVRLIVLEESAQEHNSAATLRRVAFPNLVHVINASTISSANIDAIVSCINEVSTH